MVGDSIDDMLAGHRAGVTTILIESDVNGHVKEAPETDVVITTLDQIIGLIEGGIEISARQPSVGAEAEAKSLD